jgi:hypothetical protein
MYDVRQPNIKHHNYRISFLIAGEFIVEYARNSYILLILHLVWFEGSKSSCVNERVNKNNALIFDIELVIFE